MNLRALILLWQGKRESRAEFKNVTYTIVLEKGKWKSWEVAIRVVHSTLDSMWGDVESFGEWDNLSQLISPLEEESWEWSSQELKGLGPFKGAKWSDKVLSSDGGYSLTLSCIIQISLVWRFWMELLQLPIPKEKESSWVPLPCRHWSLQLVLSLEFFMHFILSFPAQPEHLYAERNPRTFTQKES